jgi:hypothetical protein
MKITKKKLMQIIKEEAADCYSDYRAGGLTYEEYQDCLKRFADEEDYGYQRRPRKTTNVGASANEDKIAAVQAALAIKPNNFLKSILTQLQNGRGLSGKQKSIVKSIIRKSDPEAAKVFESKAPAKITKRKLRRIIKEEKAKILRESVSDMSDYQRNIERVAEQISSNFGEDMLNMFDEDPGMFEGRSTRAEWESQVALAQQELDTGIAAAIETVINEIEMGLHDGEYMTDRTGRRV